jgi:hypothetical protein
MEKLYKKIKNAFKFKQVKKIFANIILNIGLPILLSFGFVHPSKAIRQQLAENSFVFVENQETDLQKVYRIFK